MNYNFQSRKQILTLRGVYQAEETNWLDDPVDHLQPFVVHHLPFNDIFQKCTDRIMGKKIGRKYFSSTNGPKWQEDLVKSLFWGGKVLSKKMVKKIHITMVLSGEKIGQINSWHPPSTTGLLFCSNANNMAVKTAGKARKGCLNLHRPGSHRSSLKRSLLVTGKQGKAMIGLGSD